MPLPKSWIIFSIAVCAIVIVIVFINPQAPEIVTADQESSLESERATNFNVMLENSGNAIYVEDQPSVASEIQVGFAVLSAPGFVVIFNDEGGVPGKIIGASALLQKGAEHFVVLVDEALKDSQVYYAMLYHDDGDGFFQSEKDTQAQDSQSSVILMSFVAQADASPELEAVLP